MAIPQTAGRTTGFVLAIFALLLWALAIVSFGLGFYLFPVAVLVLAISFRYCARSTAFWVGWALLACFAGQGLLFVLAVQLRA